MRPRTELGAGLVVVVLLGALAAALGVRTGRPDVSDARRSTYLTGPHGARGWAVALERLGVSVERYRRREPPSVPPPMLALLDPSRPVTPWSAAQWMTLADSGTELLVAGRGAQALMECVGWSTRFVMPQPALDSSSLRITEILVPVAANEHREARLADGTAAGCERGVAGEGRLLMTRDSQPAALRLLLDSGGSMTLVADGRLFSNAAMRDTRAGEFALGLVVGRSSRIVVDEYVHGFGPGGGMLAAAQAWLRTSPARWTLVQLTVLLLLALAAAAIRFGPVQQVPRPSRRSALEHVRALATAMGAARGHQVAVAAMVQGLHRRLGRQGELPRAQQDAWLAGLEPVMRTVEGRDAVTRLRQWVHDASGAGTVRDAALAVEDVWQELRPS
jgi:hypothetical protein